MTIAGGGINTVSVNSGTGTITVTGTEADTLDTVTGRGATTANAITLSGAAPLTLSNNNPVITLASAGNNGTLAIKDGEATPNTLLTIQDLGSNGKLTVNTIAATNIGAFTSTGNITGSGTNTISNFATINGATLSGGSLSGGTFSGGSVSGGTLSGGTYTASGATVTGDFTAQIGNSSNTFNVSNGTNPIFTISDGGTVGNLSNIGAINASGTITFSGLTTNGIVTTTGGVLGSEAAVSIAQGGTGTTSTPTQGQLLIGNTSNGYSLATLTAGTGIGITNGNGTITIANNGVTSITGTNNQVIASGSTGAITLSLPQSINTGASPIFASLNLANTTNQLVLGTTNTTTISSIAPTANRTATIPALSASDTFAFLNQAQTFTNKALVDNSTTLINNSDNTKVAKFDLSGITTGTTRTLTVPNASGTIAVSASSPIALDATTGNISCPTCLSSANVVTSLNSLNGALTIAGGGINTVSVAGSTITVTGTEADTLESVTTRGATTDQALTLSNSAPLTLSDTNPIVTLGAADAAGTLTIKDSAGTPNTLLSLQDLGSAGKLTVNTIAASNIGAFTSTGNITGNGTNTISNFATINGATLSGGSLSGGSVSGGSLTGGTYTASGATVTGGYTVTLGNGTNAFSVSDGTNSLFTVTDAGTEGNVTGIHDITASGTLTLSGLTTAGLVTNDASGHISSLAQLDASRGGTGIDGSTAANGTLLIGNGSGFSLNTLTAGTGIGISNGSGSITISNSGVTSVAGTSNQVLVNGGTTAATGAITLTLPQNIGTSNSPTFGGETLNGALNLKPTTNQLVLGTTNTTTITSVAPTASRVATLPALTADDTFAFLNQTQTFTNKTIDGGSNTLTNIGNSSLVNSSITINTGTGLSGGATVALGGTISLANTGVTSIAGTANQVIASNSTGAVTLSLPQDIATTSNVNFASETLSGASPLTFSNSAPIVTLGASNADATLTIKDSAGTPNTLLTLQDLGTAGKLTVNTIAATNIGGYTLTGNIVGSGSPTLSGLGTINGATLSGGSLSGGSLSGGTYTGSGATVTGNYTLAIGNSTNNFSVTNGTNNLFTVTDNGTNGDLTNIGSINASGTLTLSALNSAGVLVNSSAGVVSSQAQLSAARGGTGLDTSAAANGKLLIGNGSGFSLNTLTAGTGIGISNGAGSITISNSGVTSLAGTSNQVSVSAATGAITLSLPQSIGTSNAPIFNGLTLNSALTATPTTNQLILGTTNTTTINSVAPTASRIATLPALTADDTFAFLNQTQTFKNKALDSTTTTFQDTTDTTKKAAFDLTSVGTGTTSTLTVPNASGTIAVSASSPLALNATTGNLTCPTCLTSGNAVTSVNSLSGAVTIAGAGINTVSVSGQTITVTGTEADTLDTVTGRGASTANAITLSGASPLTLSNSNPIITLGTAGTNSTLTVKDGEASPNTLLSLQDLGTAGKLTVDTLATNHIGAFQLTGNITGSGTPTLSGLGTINGATLSGGSLSGGTYSNSGATVTAGYTITQGNGSTFSISDGTQSIFSVADGGTVGNLSRIGNLSMSGTLTLSSLTTAGILVNDTSGNVSSQAQLSNARGGTGLDTSTAANGQLLIGNGSGFALNTLTAGSGIGITNGAGSITISNSGVTSITGTANQVSVTNGGVGAVTLSLPQDINNTATPTFGGLTLNGALNVTPTTNQLVLGTTNTTTINSAAPTASRIATLPALTGNDTFAFLNQTQTLTNKTIDGGSNTLTNIANASLVNSSVTVTAGTGLSGGGAVSLGGTITLTNAGVTSLNSTTGALTIAGGGINTVGIAGSTITVTGTEADTLASVTGRGATTATALTLSNTSPLTLSATNPIVTFGAADSNGTLTIKDTSGTPHTLLSLQDNGTSATLSVNTIAATNIGGYTLTGNITGSGSPTLSGLGTINGATLSGGTLSGGSVSGGSLQGGTYTATGASVAGDFTTTIGNGNAFNISDGTNTLFTLSDAGTKGDLSNIRNLSTSGTTTLSGLTTNGLVTVASGVLGSEAQVSNAQGGTGLDTSGASNGQLLIGNGSGGFSLANLTAGTGIGISNGAGSITISNSGVTSVAGTSNQVLVNGGTTAATGAITLTLPQSIATSSNPTFGGLTLNGALTLANGESIDNATDGTFAFNRNDAGTVTIIGKDTGANTNLIVKPNGSGSLTLGSATATGVTIATSGTGDAALTVPANSISNSELVNSAVTVTAGTGLSGGGSVSLGGNITLTNAGVTSVNSATGGLTIAGGGINTVGVAGSTITVTGTEADTLASVTGRGATTSTALTLSNATPLTLSATNQTLTLGASDSNGTLSIKDTNATPHTLLSLVDNGATATLNVDTATLSTLNATNISGFNSTGNITGNGSNTISSFASINGATISGGTLSGGSVSGGSLQGGTYTNSGATVTGGYTLTMGDTNTFTISDGTHDIFTLADAGTKGDLSNINNLTTAGTVTFSGLTTNGVVSVSSGVLSSAATLSPTLGGTGLNTSGAANGQLLIGNGSTGFSLGTLTAGTGIGISNGAGSITISNSGVTSVAGTANQVLVNGATSAATGAITLTLPQSINSTATPTFGGLTLNGALNVTPTTNQLVLGATAGNKVTINAPAPSGASRVASLPTLSADDTFAFLNTSQVFTNKTFTDNTTLFQDDGDTSKKLAFQVSNVPTSSTVTLTAPNQSGTLAVAATGPIALDASSGTISCTTCLSTTSNNFVASLNSLTGGLTIAGGGINAVSVNSGTGTITVTGTEADTLATVTGRGATTSSTVTLSSAAPLTFSNTNPVITLGAADAAGVLTIKDSNGTPHTLMTLTDNGTTATLGVNTIAASNIGGFTLTGNITGSGSPTLSGLGTINGATLSGGTLSGGSVSGGSLTGGTYTDSGATVTSGFQITQGAGSSFTVNNGTSNIMTLTDSSNTGVLTTTGSISAPVLKYNGVDINTNTALSNVAYLNKGNTFSALQTISTGGLSITGTGTLGVAGGSSLNGVNNNGGAITNAGNITGAAKIIASDTITSSASAAINLTNVSPVIQLATAGVDGSLTFTDANAHTLMTLTDLGTTADLTVNGSINGTTLKYNGTDINTNTALSNVAYLNKGNTFSALQTISTGGLSITGTGTLGVAGLTTTTGGITNNNAGIANTGAISGATTIAANSTITFSGLGTSPVSGSLANQICIDSSSNLYKCGGLNTAYTLGNTITTTSGNNVGINLSSGTSTSLSLTNSGTGTAFILNDNNTGNASTTNEFAIQASGVSNFTVTKGGSISVAGGSTPALTTLATGSNLVIRPINNTTSGGTGDNLVLNGANATGGGASVGGNVNIDAGTGTTPGTINIGTTTSNALNLGKSGVLTTNNGSFTSTQTLTASNGFTVTTGAVNMTGTSGALNLTGLGASTITSTGTFAINGAPLNLNTSTGSTNIGNNTSTSALHFISGPSASTTFDSGNTSGQTTTASYVMNANSLTSGDGLYLSSSSIQTGNLVNITTGAGNTLTSGTLEKLSSSSTAGVASGNSFLLDLSRSGANTNSGHTAYGIRSQVTNSGPTSTNIAGYFSASGGTNNYGLLVAAGNVGIGTTTPTEALNLGANNNLGLSLGTPGTLTLTPAGTGGSLAANTYYFKVTALDTKGNETLPSPENNTTTSGTTSKITVSWTTVSGASQYKIYMGTSAGGENTYFTSTANSIIVTTATGTAGSVPTVASAFVHKLVSDGTAWLNGALTIGQAGGTANSVLGMSGSTFNVQIPSTGTFAVTNGSNTFLSMVDGGATDTLNLGTSGTSNSYISFANSGGLTAATINTDASGNLIIKANATNSTVQIGSGTGDILMQPSSTYNVNVALSNAGATGDFRVLNNGTAFATFTHGGLVGFGTASPGYQLQVDSGTTADGGLKISGTGTGGGLGDMGLHINNTGTGGIDWYADSSNNGSGYGGGKLTFVRGVGGTVALSLGNGVAGFGTTNPTTVLSALGTVSAAGGGIATVTNNNTTNSANTVTLRLNTGAATGTAARWITFYTGVTSGDTGGTGRGSIHVSGTGVAFDTAAVDYAEYFSVDPSVLPANYTDTDKANVFPTGTLICTTANGVIPCNTTTDPKILGIISDSPAVQGGIDAPNTVLVGLLGQLPLKVSSANGNITAGDPLTASSIPGIAVKSTRAGEIIGRAEANYSNTDVNAVGTIQASVSRNWYDPDLSLSNTGNLNIFDTGTTNNGNKVFGVTNNGQTINRIGAFSDAVIGNLTAGTIDAQNLIIGGKNVTQTLMDLTSSNSGLTVNYNALTDRVATAEANISGLQTDVATNSAAINQSNDLANQALTLAQSFHNQIDATSTEVASLSAGLSFAQQFHDEVDNTALSVSSLSAQMTNVLGGISNSYTGSQTPININDLGQVGVGTNSAQFKLDVQDATSSAVAQLYNQSSDATSVGLQIRLGTTSPQATNKFISFLDGNGNQLGSIRGNGTSNTITFDGNGGDFAEYFKKANAAETFATGDLVCHASNGGVTKCGNTGGNGILGIVSDDASFVGNGKFRDDKNYILVGLIGQLKASIASDSQALKSGDPVTYSLTQPGKITRATTAGQIVGRAMEAFTPGQTTDKIMTSINVTWFDPTADLTENGNVAIGGKPMNNTDLTLAVNDLKSQADALADYQASTDAQIKGQSTKIASLESQLASLSAQLNASQPATVVASQSAYADASAFTTLADRITNLEKVSTAGGNQLLASEAAISGDLTVGGKTLVNDLGVTGNLTAGVMTIKGLDDNGQASINTIGDLKLQDQGAGGIDILNGRIKIDTDGNMKSSATISAKKFNVDTTDVLSASLGEITIPAGKNQVTVTTTALTKDSRIFVTPEDVPVAVATKKKDDDTFIIKLQKAQKDDVKVSWWIVN